MDTPEQPSPESLLVEQPVAQQSFLPPPPPPAAKIRRPTSVTVIGILLLLPTLPELFSLYMIYESIAGGQSHSVNPTALIFLSFFAAHLIMGIGLLRLARWARRGVIILLIARFITFVALCIIVLFMHYSPANIKPEPGAAVILIGLTIGSLFGIAIYSIAINFLTRPQVKAAFARGEGRCPPPPRRGHNSPGTPLAAPPTLE